MRRLGSTLLVPGALAALVIVLAGCGGKGQHATKHEPTPAHLQHGRVTAAAYKRRLQRINLQEQALTNNVRTRIQKVRTVPQVRRVLLGYANEQLRIGRQVGLILPPKKAVKANALLARGFRDMAIQLKALLPRLSKAKSAHAALVLIQQTQPRGGRELDRAVTQLKQLGFSPTAKPKTGGTPPSQHY